MTPEPNANHPDQPRAMLDAKKKNANQGEKKETQSIQNKQKINIPMTWSCHPGSD